jgi:hypothetical protein
MCSIIKVMLIFHIIVAVASIVYATFNLLNPVRRNTKLSYSFITATTASGFALIYMNPAYAVQGCVSYVLYIIAVVTLTRSTNLRLAK